MIKALIAAVVGLLLGVGGTWAYDRYLGAGAELARTEDKVASDSTALTQASQSTAQLKSEVDSLTAQVKQVLAQNGELQGQVEQFKKTAPAAAPAPNPMTAMVQAQIHQQSQTKLALLKSRLNLTPDQEAAIQAAMDRDEKKTMDTISQMFQGGKVDPQAMKASDSVSLDQTIDNILTPDQKTAYQQMKTDEHANQAEMMASFEMTQAAPLLQLSDAQKDQVVNALYQLNLDNTNPDKIKAAVGNSTDPTAFLDAQAQAKETALAKILTPAQQAQYHQQLQTQLETQKAAMKMFTPAATSTP